MKVETIKQLMPSY